MIDDPRRYLMLVRRAELYDKLLESSIKALDIMISGKEKDHLTAVIGEIQESWKNLQDLC